MNAGETYSENEPLFKGLNMAYNITYIVILSFMVVVLSVRLIKEFSKIYIDGFKILQFVMFSLWGLIGVPFRILILI